MVKNRRSHFLSHELLLPLSERQCVDLVNLLREVHLLLLVDYAKARRGHQTTNYCQVSTHAAVHLVGDHALIRHVVLDDNEAVGLYGFLTTPQELN